VSRWVKLGEVMRVPYPLPARRKREKMGIQKAPQRKWPRHRRWVKSHSCCVPDCPALEVDFAHIRTAANAGVALKSHDSFGVPLCFNHHREQHQVGHTFEDRHGIDLDAIAAEFVRTSPDYKMKLMLALETSAAAESAAIPIRLNPGHGVGS
jgi:hypothetical protein